jgi:hypothetical protein
MFYPDLFVYELVFCVVGSPAYLDMRDFPRLELGAHILRDSGQNIISATQELGVIARSAMGISPDQHIAAKIKVAPHLVKTVGQFNFCACTNGRGAVWISHINAF